MFCPNCGATNSADQNFCRACGIALEDISNALATQIPASGSLEREPINTAIEKLGKVGLIGLGVAGLVGVAAMIYAIFTKLILSGANIAGGILFIAVLVFAVLSLVYVINRESVKERKKLRHAAKPIIIDEAATSQLDSGVSPPSITEGTTRQLK